MTQIEHCVVCSDIHFENVHITYWVVLLIYKHRLYADMEKIDHQQ